MLKKEDVQDIKNILINGAKWSSTDFEDENMHTIAEWMDSKPEPMFTRSEVVKIIDSLLEQQLEVLTKKSFAEWLEYSTDDALNELVAAIKADLYEDEFEG